MKKIFLILLFAGTLLSGKAQHANPDVTVLMIPGTLRMGQTGTLKVRTCNTGTATTDQIVANSLRITVSVGPNAEILGIDQPTSDSRWTQLNLDPGPSNTILLKNTGGTMTAGGNASDCAVINLIVKAVDLDGGTSDLIGANIVYIAGPNPLIGGLQSIIQGDESPDDNNNTTSLTVLQSLPVDIINFTAQKVTSHSLINWSYSNAVNFSHFELERSSDGASFSNLNNKQYKITGNTASAAQFSETDMQPLSGDNYYRLKMVDMDGKYSYSEIRKLNFVVAGIINVFPNPATDRIKITGATAGSTIMLFDPEGKLLQSKKASGNLVDEMLLTGYTGGQYIIKITGGNISTNVRILKL